MVLQERDYTKFISEEEKSAFELEMQIAGRKGIKIIENFQDFLIQMKPLENLYGINDHYFQIIICIY